MAPDAGSCQAVQEQLNALSQRRDDIKALASAVPDAWVHSASPEDIIVYCDRERIFGAQKALRWLASRN